MTSDYVRIPVLTARWVNALNVLPRWVGKAGVALLAAGCVVVSPPARTQAPSNEYPVAESGTAQVDPPGRVGRISLLSGPVSITDLQSNDTENATLNWPITSAHRINTGRLGRAEVRIGSVAVRVDDESIVDFNRIDDEVIQVVVQRGTAAVRVRSRDVLREIDLLTPRERIALEDVGRYRIDVDRATGVTAVTALVGYARVTSGRSTFVVQSGQRGEVTGAPGASFQLVGYATDVFDDWVAARDRRDDASRSAQYVSRETTGIESLDEHGTWSSAADYGPVWYPATVPAGWAPYRYGRWVHMSPWGWTWIDEAPWGFAPFHYGRWVVVGGRWCWAPGRYIARPYYAPALVAWYGRPGLSISVSSGHAVGWFPLGWNDVYYPAYRHSPRYIRSVNVQNVTNITNVTIVNPPANYAHQRHPDSVSWAPVRSLPRRDRVQDVMTSRPPDDLVRVAPVARAPVVVDVPNPKRTLPVVAEGIAPARPAPRPGMTLPGSTESPAPIAAPDDRVRVNPPRGIAPSTETSGPKRLEPSVPAAATPPQVIAPRVQPVPRGAPVQRDGDADNMPRAPKFQTAPAPVFPAPAAAPPSVAPPAANVPPPRTPRFERSERPAPPPVQQIERPAPPQVRERAPERASPEVAPPRAKTPPPPPERDEPRPKFGVKER